MRLLKILLALVVLLLVIGGVLLWTVPADFAYRQGARFLGPVVLSGVRGTLWDGHADGVSVLGRDLGEIDWRMSKGGLLRGSMVADVRVQGSGIYLSAVGHGTVMVDGAGDQGVADGVMSIDDGPYESLPDFATTFDLGTPPTQR